jgi:hypothetical protein
MRPNSANRIYIVDGYKLSFPPTPEQIDAVGARMASYASPTDGYPRPDKLNRLGNRLTALGEDLHMRGRTNEDCLRAADAIMDLARIAFDSANDLS